MYNKSHYKQNAIEKDVYYKKVPQKTQWLWRRRMQI